MAVKSSSISSFPCSFCKRTKEEVKQLIAGKNANDEIGFICNICVEVCYKVLQKDNSEKISKNIKFQKPMEIYEALCEKIQGQEEAKKHIAIAAYNHYKRVFFSQTSDVKPEKSNLLLIGPSGCGKTYLVEILSKILNVPFVIFDTKQLTET